MRLQIWLPRLVTGLLLLLLLAVAVGPLLLPIRDPDFFWHLRTGEWIWQHRALPHDFPGAAVPQETPAQMQRFTLTSYWASQVALYLVHAAGGMGAVVALRFALLGTLLFLLWRRQEGDDLVRLGLLTLAVSALTTFPPERPQYLSFVFAALLMWLLDGFRDLPSAALRRRAVMVPLLFLAWANCHGGYVVGLALVALAGLGESIKQLHPRLGPLPPDRWRLLLGSGAAGLLVSFVNPNGGYVFKFAVLPAWLRDFLTEYRSTIDLFSNLGDRAYVAYWLVLALTVVGLIASWRRPDPTALILTMVTGYLSFTQSRFVPFFIVVALPVACRALTGARLVRLARVAVTVAAVTAAGILLERAGGRFLDVRFTGEVDRRLFPVEAVEFIEREGLRDNIFCNYEWGGYLLWRLAPAKVFIDGRNADRDLLRTYQSILEGDAGDGGEFRKVRFAAAGIRLVVIDFFDSSAGSLRGLVDDLVMDPAWEPVFSSPRVVVFAEATVEKRATLARIAIPKQEFAEHLLLFCSHVIAAAPGYVPVYVTRGDLLLRLGDREGALRSWQEALRLAPRHRPAQERIEGLSAQ